MPFPSRPVCSPQVSKMSTKHHTRAINPMVIFVLNYCNCSQYPFEVFYIHQNGEAVRELETLLHTQSKGEMLWLPCLARGNQTGPWQCKCSGDKVQ